MKYEQRLIKIILRIISRFNFKLKHYKFLSFCKIKSRSKYKNSKVVVEFRCLLLASRWHENNKNYHTFAVKKYLPSRLKSKFSSSFIEDRKLPIPETRKQTIPEQPGTGPRIDVINLWKRSNGTRVRDHRLAIRPDKGGIIELSIP